MGTTRRQFLKRSGATLAGAMLGSSALLGSGCGDSGREEFFFPLQGSDGTPGRRPNILLVLVDQMRLPPVGYGPNEGEAAGIKEILGFAPQLSPQNEYAQYFPGMLRLRKNAVVLRQHYIASAACAPSRTTLLTGQYPSVHGVDQVDGIFKGAEEIKWLDENGVPTAGDWFRAAGYDTHYFGKWHVSHVPEGGNIEEFGFSGFETSTPEPHGSDTNNLGVYRDPGFLDIVTGFFDEVGAKPQEKPWFAVASFVNPHDIAAYPTPFYAPEINGEEHGVTEPPVPLVTPQPIPGQGTISNESEKYGRVPLNPDGFPQENFTLPLSADEDLTNNNKPSAQVEQAWKVQMGLRSLFPEGTRFLTPYPLQLRGAQAQEWALRYGQFYLYLQYLVEQELEKMMEAFDRNGLDENTIVVFTSDHGEYAMSHGLMLQKWHTGYEEVTRVPMVISSPKVNASEDVLKEVDVPTSHIDLLPTLLGLAGVTEEHIPLLKERIQGHQVEDLVGADVTPHILGRAGGSLRNPDGTARPGVLFTTDDAITEIADVPDPEKLPLYESYLESVETAIGLGAPLVPGPVAQPSSVRLLCTGDWKITRYLDPNGVESDQWEVYHLPTDPREMTNLVDFRTGQLVAGASVAGFTGAQLQAQIAQLRADLAAQESQMLKIPANA